MAVSFNVPKAPKKSVMKIDTFLGADFTNSPANADDNKSPNLVNMIRDVPGKIRKCMGYETVADYTVMGFNYDDVVNDVKKTIEQGNMTISIQKHLMDFTFTGNTTTTITFDNGLELFDQDILSTYYSYFGTSDILKYVKANMELPSWITGISVQTYEVAEETHYTLRFNITGATEADSLNGLEFKFIDSDILTRQAKLLFTEGNDSYGSLALNLYAYKEDDGSFQISTAASSATTGSIVFPQTWTADDDGIGTRLNKWLSYYQNPDWSRGRFFPTEDGGTFFSIFGTYDIKDKFISSDMETSIFNYVYICFGYTVGHSDDPYYCVVANVTTSENDLQAPYMTLRLLEDPTILDVEYPNNVSLRSAPSDEEEEEPGEYQINGFHKLRTDEYGLIHCGTKLYRNKELLYSDANNHRSMSWEFDEHLFIVDGKKLLRYGLTKPTSDIKYKETKDTNEVVINEEVGIVVQRFNTPNYALAVVNPSTTSENGRFEVNSDNTTITYYDTLTEVGQTITYSCSWEYKVKKSSGKKTGSMSEHYLKGISDQGVYKVEPVEDVAHIPLLTISKDPDAGGTARDPLNLLCPGFTEGFLPKQNTDPSTGEPTTWMDDYYMSFDDLDEVVPIVKQLDMDTGEWVELEVDVDFTVDYAAGCIHFSTPPTRPETWGSDTIFITAYRTVERYQGMINKCTIGTLFGVGGANDRLFLSGNPDYINYDWYSGSYTLVEEYMDDAEAAKAAYSSPVYFPDTGYATLGSSSSAIIGYSRVSNYLAAHKDKYERDQNIILREGDLVESEPSFRIINTLQGAGAVAPYSFAYLTTEPIFLTEQGIFAVTAQDITGEKYAQNRSYFLDGKLLEEEDLSQAYGYVYNDLYWLCLNNVAYILDGLQPLQTDKSKPYSTRQYAGFYRTNLPAYTMWEDNGRLFFGTKDGRVCRFYKDKYDLNSYNDDGEVIECTWETPDITGQVFFKNKTLRDIAIKLDTATAASVNIYVMDRGIWRFIRTDHWRARIFQFSTIVFSKFTFNCDKTQRTFLTKFRVKKVDKFRLRLTNDQLNESFALSDVGFEYVEKGNYTR